MGQQGPNAAQRSGFRARRAASAVPLVAAAVAACRHCGRTATGL